MSLPNFLVIGAQKSGTTWLHQFLGKRPDIHVPTARKELMFFDNEERFSALGVEGYERFFSNAGGIERVGEVTPGYLWTSNRYPEWGGVSDFRQAIPNRVREILGGDVKIVAVLRNPIDRALSGFMHHRKKGRIGDRETLRANFLSNGIVHIGFYAAHLDHWATRFPRDSFFVTTYEALFAEPEQREGLLRFLGCKGGHDESLSEAMVHRGLGFVRDSQGAFDSAGHRFADAEDIETLREAYRPDVAELAAWVDVSRWKSDFG